MVIGEWFSFPNIRLHDLGAKPTRIALVDSIVELSAIIGEFERLMDDIGLSGSIVATSRDAKSNYARFRDTYNHFLTSYEAFCREAAAVFREIREPAFKRLD